jgi:hypothetical protein
MAALTQQATECYSILIAIAKLTVLV